MRQGVWQCRSCRQWWYWKIHRSTTLFDRRCPKCQTRHRTVLDRRPGRRGRPLQFQFQQRPSYEPRSAIRQELIRRNQFVEKRRSEEAKYQQLELGTFVKASELRTQGEMAMDDHQERSE